MHSLLGAYLRRARRLCNLSQKKVATKLGYKSAQFVSNWERGHCLPPIAKLKQIQKMYHLSTEELTQRFLEAEKKRLLDSLA